MQRIEKEMKAAQHLLYVSLKYTKTCDVILNLIQRWSNTIALCIDALLNKAKNKKIIKAIPLAPKPKIEALEKVFKKEEIVKSTLSLYSFFRKVPTAELIREHEFRKNVALRILLPGKETIVDLEKLKEWQDLLENFIKFVRVYVA